MPISGFGFAMNSNWSLVYGTPTGFHAATESDQTFFALSALNVTNWNQVYATSQTVAISGSFTIDLTSLTNLVQESFSFMHVKSIYVSTTGADITFGPGMTNGLQWFLDDVTATITIKNGGSFAFSDVDTTAPAASTVVNGTNKTLTFTNLSGADTTIVEVVILGSTT